MLAASQELKQRSQGALPLPQRVAAIEKELASKASLREDLEARSAKIGLQLQKVQAKGEALEKQLQAARAELAAVSSVAPPQPLQPSPELFASMAQSMAGLLPQGKEAEFMHCMSLFQQLFVSALAA